MTTIGVVADTHIPSRARSIPGEVLEALHGVSMILHAGDLTTDDVIQTLEELAPVKAVYGNIDPDDLVSRLTGRRVIPVESALIGLVHGHEGKGRTTADRALRAFANERVQCVVFGHTHAPLCEERNGILLLNPGSCTDRRTQPRRSFGFLYVDGDQVRGEIRFL